MKKIIFAIAICIASFTASQAQIESAFTMTGNGDTITNTGTKTNTLKVKTSANVVGIHTVITKISGTVAGTVTLQGSNDGTTYLTVDTTLAVSKKVTFTATNTATQGVYFTIKDSPYLYLRISYTGSGTMAASMRSYLVPRQFVVYPFK